MNTSILTIALIITILGASTHAYLFTPAAYHSLTDKYSSHPDARNTSENTIAFFLGDDNALNTLNERELSHMHDVRTLIHILFLLYSVSLLFTLYHLSHPLLCRAAITASVTTLLLLAAALLTPFAPLFDLFHRAFFAPGTWLFPYESILIQTYPAPFFAAFFTRIGITALTISCFLLGTASALRISLLKHNKP